MHLKPPDTMRCVAIWYLKRQKGIMHYSMICFFSQVYDGQTNKSAMFTDQPEMIRGVWHRPAIASSGNFIYLKFVPNKLRMEAYAGFKAVAYATNSM